MNQMVLTALQTLFLPFSLTHTPEQNFTEEDRIAFLTQHHDLLEGICSLHEHTDASPSATVFTYFFRVKILAHAGAGTHSARANTRMHSRMHACTHTCARTHTMHMQAPAN